MSKKLKTLNEALIEALKDIHSAESQLIKALPKMAKKADCQDLSALFSEHLEETKEQLTRLEEIGTLMQQKLSGKTCKAMKGLIEEGTEILELESDNPAIIDVMLVGAASRIEHYEIAAYESTLSIADELDEEEIVHLLEKSLSEESAANTKLCELCEEKLMVDATPEQDRDDKVNGAAVKSRRSSRGAVRSGASRLLLVTGVSSFLFMNGAIGCADRDAGVQADRSVTSSTSTTSDSRDTASTRQRSDGTYVATAESDSARASQREIGSGESDSARASKREHDADQYKPDNTGKNVRDSNKGRMTAGDQDMFGSETEILASIRREIVANENMSTYGKNVKVIIEDGVVTLRGPVATSSEKEWIERTTVSQARGFQVNNQLEVQPR